MLARHREALEPLLAFIRDHEANGNYDAVWARIAKRDRPIEPITSMTVRQVLAWQESIDRLYQSEAAGAYQFLEDTLRALGRKGVVGLDDRFDAKTQDRLAIELMRGRGLDAFLAGGLTVAQFCNRLAMEWASLPVVTPVQRTVGERKWTVPIGASYYAGDGLNASRSDAKAFMAVVAAVRQPASALEAIVAGAGTPGAQGLSPAAHGGFWAGLAAAAIKPFRKLFGA